MCRLTVGGGSVLSYGESQQCMLCEKHSHCQVTVCASEKQKDYVVKQQTEAHDVSVMCVCHQQRKYPTQENYDKLMQLYNQHNPVREGYLLDLMSHVPACTCGHCVNCKKVT